MEVSNLSFHLPEIDIVGSVSLDFFLVLTLMTLDLIKLVNADVPMLDILLTETVLMALGACFITFKFCGNDYNEAVMVVGHCGIGLLLYYAKLRELLSALWVKIMMLLLWLLDILDLEQIKNAAITTSNQML